MLSSSSHYNKVIIALTELILFQRYSQKWEINSSSPRYTPFRVIWILATLTCSGFLIWQISTQIDLYYKHNKKTLLTMNYNPITFPDVTICNHRLIDLDILYSLSLQYHLNHGNINLTYLYQMKNLSRARPRGRCNIHLRLGFRQAQPPVRARMPDVPRV